jgi:hypothetical protein
LRDLVWVLSAALLLFCAIVGQASAAVSDVVSVSKEPDFDSADKAASNRPVKVPWWGLVSWPQERRLALLGLTSLGTVTVIGLSEWDYGTTSFKFRDEGWFAQGTYRGGADKLGHAWAGYALTSIYRGIYRSWGSGDRDALLRGVASSAAVMTLVEVGDGFSRDYGFSWQDGTMNIAGVALAYLRHTYPELEKRVDFRAEWRPWETRDSSQRFFLAFKLGGFLGTDNPVFQAVDFQIGYYTRGYTSTDDGTRPVGRHRYGYVGVGLNVTYLFEKLTGNRAAGVFDYIQIPGTSVTSR